MIISISVVVPVYSGERYLRKLVEELNTLRQEWESENTLLVLGEVILVDDDAIDGSPDLIDQLASERPWVTALHMARNFGQHAATIAGILHSAGDWVVTMDEDLQHPPSRILDMLKAAALARCDIVYAAAQGGGVHESFLRDLSSRSYKHLIAWLTGNPDISKVNSFRLIRGAVARAASSVCGYDTYFDVALSWFSRRVEVVSMPLKDIRFIASKNSGYNLKSLMSHARRLLVSSQVKLLRTSSVFGFLAVAATILFATAILILKFVQPEAIQVEGWLSTVLVISFFGGLTMFLLGVTIEYLSIVTLWTHGKPLFFTIDRSTDEQLRREFGESRG